MYKVNSTHIVHRNSLQPSQLGLAFVNSHPSVSWIIQLPHHLHSRLRAAPEKELRNGIKKVIVVHLTARILAELCGRHMNLDPPVRTLENGRWAPIKARATHLPLFPRYFETASAGLCSCIGWSAPKNCSWMVMGMPGMPGVMGSHATRPTVPSAKGPLRATAPAEVFLCGSSPLLSSRFMEVVIVSLERNHP